MDSDVVQQNNMTQLFFDFDLNKVLLYFVVGLNFFMSAFFISYIAIHLLCWKLKKFSKRIEYFYDYLQVRNCSRSYKDKLQYDSRKPGHRRRSGHIVKAITFGRSSQRTMSFSESVETFGQRFPLLQALIFTRVNPRTQSVSLWDEIGFGGQESKRINARRRGFCQRLREEDMQDLKRRCSLKQ